MSRLRSTALILAVQSSVLCFAADFGSYNLITEDRLKAHLTFIAHDLLEGRDTPSRGLDIAAEYIAAQCKLWGAKPGGDNGTYFQNMALRAPVTVAEGTSFSISGAAFKYAEDFAARPVAGFASGGTVYAGTGWIVPSIGLDSFKGLDVKDKIVVVHRAFTPPGMTFSELRGPKGQGAIDVTRAAAARGAKSVVYLVSDSEMPGIVRQTTTARRAGPSQPASNSIPEFFVGENIAKALFTGESSTIEKLNTAMSNGAPVASFALNKSISASASVNENKLMTKNVIAIVEGRDKALSAEYVAVGAHYDHIGMRPNARPGEDAIYNGADDDGSGTVALLEMAHAFAQGKRPKRSVIFVWHTGEEKGLWGSDYFVNNPTVPLKNILCQLNIDMIGRSATPGVKYSAQDPMTDNNSVYVIGGRRISNELGDIAEQVNHQLFRMKYDGYYDRPNDPQNLYGRSDHYNYAKMGIPIMFWFDGIHEDYHRVGDEISKIDFNKLCKVTQTIHATAFTLGERKDRLKITAPVKPSGGGN